MIITKDLLKKMRPEIDEALKVVAQKYGMTVHVGNIKFSSDNFVVKTDFKVIQKASDGSVIDPRKIEFEKNAILFGFKPSDFGKEVVIQGEKFQLTGLKLGASKRPCVITRVSDGKNFVCPVINIPMN